VKPPIALPQWLPDSAPHDLQLDNLPRPCTREDYDHAIQKVAAHLIGWPEVVAVYQIGQVGEPGISDIDLIAVFDDKARRVARTYKAILDDADRYLFMHGVFGMPVSVFRRRQWLIPIFDCHLIAGRDVSVRNELSEEEQRELTRIYGIEFLFVNLFSVLDQMVRRRLKVRNLLCSLKALAYDLKALHTPLPEPMRRFIDSVMALRQAACQTRSVSAPKRAAARGAVGEPRPSAYPVSERRSYGQADIVGEPLRNSHPVSERRGYGSGATCADNATKLQPDSAAELSAARMWRLCLEAVGIILQSLEHLSAQVPCEDTCGAAFPYVQVGPNGYVVPSDDGVVGVRLECVPGVHALGRMARWPLPGRAARQLLDLQTALQALIVEVPGNLWVLLISGGGLSERRGAVLADYARFMRRVHSDFAIYDTFRWHVRGSVKWELLRRLNASIFHRRHARPARGISLPSRS